jgi:DNA-binding winged helix-turn-helix (wHTH) protein
LDKATATLWRGDQVVPLRPKSFAALCYLLERHGQLVTKDELLDAVWQRRSVGEAVLKVCINELRQALCDNASQQTYLIAVPGCGYQLDVQVVERSGWGEKMKLAKYPTPTSVNSPPRYRQSHEVVEQSDGAVFKLSERETEIMDLVRKGKTNAEIGSILCIGPYAVKYQLHQIFRKLDVYNRTQAASKIERGLPLSVNSPIAPKRGRKLKIF